MDEQEQEAAERVADTWTSMSPNQRTEVRLIDGELYDTLGALATVVYVARAATERRA